MTTLQSSVRRSSRGVWGAVVFVLCLGEAGCITLDNAVPDQTLEGWHQSTASTSKREAYFQPASATQIVADTTGMAVRKPTIIQGRPVSTVSLDGLSRLEHSDGAYVLNFDNVDIRDVIKSVLGDMLDLSYVVDPAVTGQLTLHTAKPLSREEVLPALEQALRLADAAVVSGSSGYQVVSLKGAAQKGALGVAGSAFRPGYQVRVVPLRYVTTADVQRVLEPLVAPGTIVQGDPKSGIVTLAGTEAEVIRAEQAITTFDVDWLRSQSFGLFPLRYSSAADVAADLESVVGKEGSLAGVVRIAPIAHMNAILVVSRNFAHIREMREWIERFDRGKDASKPRLYVYRVQNGRAQDLASVLTKVFAQHGGSSGNSDDAASEASTLGQPASTIASPSSAGTGGNGVSGFQTTTAGNSLSPFGGLPATGNSGPGNQQAGLKITADDINNALLVVTTPTRYAQVEAALAQLDITPTQLLLEASIIEVNVTDTFKYGVQTSFQQNGISALSSSVAAAALAPSTGGLSAALLKTNIQATLDFLSTLTKVRVISAPKLMVLNNRSASIQVGDQVPIATSSAVSTITANAPTVNTIQLIDTGIILHVTPRVNRTGLVMMDMSQEVSASVPTDSSSINSPTIQQRRVSTSVAVQDGQTIAIGGLIHDNRTRNRTGVPFLKDIPNVGALFGVTNDETDRTELMVLITPHVIRSSGDADAATDELSAQLPMLRNMRSSQLR